MQQIDYATCPINVLTEIIIHEVYQTYFMYGPGLFERVYEATLEGRLKERGLRVERQTLVTITNRYVNNEPGYYADLIVEGRVILELKSVLKLNNVVYTQLRSHLRLAKISVGYVVNFNCKFLKDNIKRVVHNYDPAVHDF